MPFNGSGLFTRVHNWVTDKGAAVKITASRMDTEDDGFATGLSNCITKDGQTTVSQNIPFNSKKITGLGDATAAADAMNRQASDARYPVLSGANAFVGNQTITGTLGVTGLLTLTGGGALGAALACADFGVLRPYLADIAELINARGTISGAQTIDLELGNVASATINGNTTFAFSNWPATGRAGTFMLVLTNGGAHTITWPAAVKFPNATPPVLTASGRDRIVFMSQDAGTTIDGVVSGKAFG